MVVKLIVRYLVPVVLVLGLLWVAYDAGYDKAKLDEELKTRQLIAEYQKKINSLQEGLYETEKAWLEEDTKVTVEYRDKYIKVKEYVESGDYSNCKLDDVGLQLVNQAIRSSNR